MPPRSTRSSRIAGHRPSPESSRRRRPPWPWLIAAGLAVVLGLVLPGRCGPPPLSAPRIGLVAGHWQSDSGATCPDGWREVDITLPVARRVVDQLRQLGYQAEVLPEYADALPGYRALAFVSLHADSCLAEFTGFKVASRNWGPAAETSARLATVLTRRYAAATGLQYHQNTVTTAMTHYHAFFLVGPHTPAVIVELGFMGGDRELLTVQQDRLAQGIVEGLLEFLSAEGVPPPATPTAAR